MSTLKMLASDAIRRRGDFPKPHSEDGSRSNVAVSESGYTACVLSRTSGEPRALGRSGNDEAQANGTGYDRRIDQSRRPPSYKQKRRKE